MNARPHGRLERFGFAALVLLTLSPVVIQGLWRPLAQAFHGDVDCLRVTCCSLAVATAELLAHAATAQRRENRWLPGALAGLVALACGGGVGRDSAAIATATAALLGVAAFCAALLPWLLGRLPAGLDGAAAGRRGITAVLIVLGVATVAETTRLGVFMGDASHPEFSTLPDMPFLVHHSCLTAYVEGAGLATEGVDNLYDMARWPDLNGTPRSEAYAGRYAPFGLDAFAYPPPFLLLPRLLISWLGTFASQRAVWFTANGLFVAAGLGIVAAWLGGRAGQRALLLAPLIWISPPTLATLQVGNIHLAVMVAAMLALVAFESRRPALGGALLAFAVVAKISPGLLLLVLLLRGRIREVLWTAGFMLVFVVLALLVFGDGPFIAFVSYELPRLSSGEALTFLAGPESIPINLAPFGIPFKLAFLGVPVGDPWGTARLVSQGYTVIIVVLTAAAARTDNGPRATAQMWAAVLVLASLRSPLAPGYVSFALLWLLSIRAIEIRGVAQILGMAATWALLVVVPPLGPEHLVMYSLLQQCLVLGLAMHFLVRQPSAEAPLAGSVPQPG